MQFLDFFFSFVVSFLFFLLSFIVAVKGGTWNPFLTEISSRVFVVWEVPLIRRSLNDAITHGYPSTLV